MINRNKTRAVKIGNIYIGANYPIAIQSMTNTKTKDITSTVKQINDLTNAGCDIIRVAVLDSTDAQALKEIIPQIKIPLVADIHFDYRLALLSLEAGVSKLRINPGNIGSIEKITSVVNACKEKKVPIRIGINLGSLERDIQYNYGRTAQAMIESAKRHIKILEELDFHDIILSLKASDVKIMIEAYQMAAQIFNYPLHIGVTEAGTEFAGSIKSAIGTGILLYQGIGDTIRVSLSSDPVLEVMAVPGHAPHSLFFSLGGYYFIGEAASCTFEHNGTVYFRATTPPRFEMPIFLKSINKMLNLPQRPAFAGHSKEPYPSQWLLRRSREQLIRWHSLLSPLVEPLPNETEEAHIERMLLAVQNGDADLGPLGIWAPKKWDIFFHKNSINEWGALSSIILYVGHFIPD